MAGHVRGDTPGSGPIPMGASLPFATGALFAQPPRGLAHPQLRHPNRRLQHRQIVRRRLSNCRERNAGVERDEPSFLLNGKGKKIDVGKLTGGCRRQPTCSASIRIVFAELIDQFIRDDAAARREWPKTVDCLRFLYGKRLLRSQLSTRPMPARAKQAAEPKWSHRTEFL